MIRRLRDRHRRMIVIVALLTGLVFGWALIARATAEPPSRRVAESPR